MRTSNFCRAMRATLLAALSVLPLPSAAFAQDAHAVAANASAKTTLVILGVAHSAQLAGPNYHAGYFRAFFDIVRPAAICVERSPDEYARGDFYEFTYEAQHIAVPYARSHGIDICPIDWLPSRDDERLAFGRLEVVDPPIVRPAAGFQAFFALDSSALSRTVFFADSAAAQRATRNFFDGPRRAGWPDFPRRLDLYRTFMQAMRIRAAAAAHPGQTVIVVAGSLHKEDIERVLGADTSFRIVQPASFGAITAASANAALTRSDMFAIASFNLLGVQSTEGAVDWLWVDDVLSRLTRGGAQTPELRLLTTRRDVLTRHLAPQKAAEAYARIASDAPARETFTFTGVEDARRIDSYYDPFGNLTVRERALVEAAREHAAAGDSAATGSLEATLLHNRVWSPLQRAQLFEYWSRYINVKPKSAH